MCKLDKQLEMDDTEFGFLVAVALLIITVVVLYLQFWHTEVASAPEYGEDYKCVTILYGGTGIEGYITADDYYALVNERPIEVVVVYDPLDRSKRTEVNRRSIRAVLD